LPIIERVELFTVRAALCLKACQLPDDGSAAFCDIGTCAAFCKLDIPTGSTRITARIAFVGSLPVRDAACAAGRNRDTLEGKPNRSRKKKPLTSLTFHRMLSKSGL